MSKIDELLNNAIKITLTKTEIETVKYNAELKLDKMLRQARELESEARTIRNHLKSIKSFAEFTEVAIAHVKAQELLEKEGMSEKEIEEYFNTHGITWDIIEE